jgi:hypothetical protein
MGSGDMFRVFEARETFCALPRLALGPIDGGAKKR